MSNKTFIQIVNRLQRRLREAKTGTVLSSGYSELLGDFVNEAKREVEDAWDWNCLRDTVQAVTSKGVRAYALTGSGKRARVLSVLNDTNNSFLFPVSQERATYNFLGPGGEGAPRFYSFNGEYNGDLVADLYPIPDGVYTVNFNLVVPQVDLVNDADELYVPDEPVYLGALMKAIEERGEDGGISSALVSTRYTAALADAIAQDVSRMVDETDWHAV